MTANAARDCLVPLFVPGDRPDRFVKAANSGADAVIVDLEDAVAPANKPAARANLRALTRMAVPVFVRINAPGTAWHEDDLAALAGLTIDGVQLPKAESAAAVERASAAIGGRDGVIALIESALGVAQARAIAKAKGIARLAFGSLDFCADMGCAHTRDVLYAARSEMVMASRLGGLTGPLDGVTMAIDDEAEIESDAAYAASLGYAGKVLIHPKQIAAARRGFAPSAKEIAWAEKIMAAAGGGAVKVDGTMVDAPVRMRAEQILKRAKL